MLGAMAFVCRLTQGMADIFWVAGPLTIALLLVGHGPRARARGRPRLEPMADRRHQRETVVVYADSSWPGPS